MKIYILIIAILITTSIFFLKDDQKIDEPSKIEIKKEVIVKKIIEDEFVNKLKLSGFSEASRIVVLKSQVVGKVSSKYFSKGEAYKAGQQILLVDPEDKIARLKEMEALLNQRKKEYEVAENLFKKGFRSEVKLSESRTNFENALASYERSQVELNNTKISLPFDSVIEESYVELGDYLKKGDPLAKIVDLDPIFVSVNTSEKEISNIFINQNSKVEIAGKIYPGLVNYISKTSDPETRNFKVQIKIDNKNSEILSGLSSKIEIELQPQKAFFIASSLISLDDKGRIGIKIVENEKVIFLPINIISDVGDGYWVNIQDEQKRKEIYIISQGKEYTISGEVVDIKFEDND